jgi:2-amino-4-hydroxy-6-hydroxymethyldihydropteridine diphosphokinase
LSRPWVTAYIAAGANLGDARATVAQALRALGTPDDLRVLCCSSLYSTVPVDATGPDYINAVVEISTLLTAPDLLARLHQIELNAGRKRPYRNAPRTLDLDILLYGNASIDSPTLKVPHPRMWQRAFVLVPLAEIAPQKVTAVQLQAVQSQTIERLPCAFVPRT